MGQRLDPRAVRGAQVLRGGAGLFVLAGSVYMVYELEILKARHFQVLARRKPPPPEEETEDAVEEYAAATPD